MGWQDDLAGELAHRHANRALALDAMPREEGKAARQRGDGTSRNPYPEGSQQQSEWLKGWRETDKQHRAEAENLLRGLLARPPGYDADIPSTARQQKAMCAAAGGHNQQSGIPKSVGEEHCGPIEDGYDDDASAIIPTVERGQQGEEVGPEVWEITRGRDAKGLSYHHKAGEAAKAAGKPDTDNPYPPKSDPHRFWKEGYHGTASGDQIEEHEEDFPHGHLPPPRSNDAVDPLVDVAGRAPPFGPHDEPSLREVQEPRDVPEGLATDPPVSEAQRRAMWAAREGHSTLGIPKSVGEKFVGHGAHDADFDSELRRIQSMTDAAEIENILHALEDQHPGRKRELDAAWRRYMARKDVR